MKTKNFSVTGASAWIQEGPWSVLFYESGTDVGGQTARIRIQSADGRDVDFEAKPGRQISLKSPAQGIIITSLTGNAISGKISVGVGDIRDSSLLGTVEMIDGGKARTVAGQMGIASYQIVPVAATFASVGVWNPAGSGKRVIVKRANISSTINQLLYVNRITAALSSATAPQSMLLDGSVYPGAALRTFENLAALPPAGTRVGVCTLAGNTLQLSFDEPFVVMPGNGLSFTAVTANTDINCQIPFYEESV